MIEYEKRIDAIVYTMGKVGSSTVSTSIRRAGLGCLDVHFLHPERITEVLSANFKNPEVSTIPRHILASLLAHNALIRQQAVRLITLIREPVMRNISAVFQNTPAEIGGDYDAIMKRLQNYPTRTPDYWFETDFIPVTGLDVFNMELDCSNDHFRLTGANCEVLILKLESDDARKSELISEFLGVDVPLARANEANKKWYYHIYKKIVDDPSGIRPQFVEECMNLKYFRTFYSESEMKMSASRFA